MKYQLHLMLFAHISLLDFIAVENIRSFPKLKMVTNMSS